MKFLNHNKRNLIQLEVILGFSVALIILGAAALINFYSLNKLVTAVNTISEPDKVLVTLRKITVYLSEEEQVIRSYTLSKQAKYLDAYRSTTDSLHIAVARLKLYTIENQKQTVMADSVSDYVAAREGLLGSYIEKRRSTLEQEINNNKYTGPPPSDKKVSDTKKDSVEKKGGIYAFFKSVFGGDKDKNETATDRNDKRDYHSQEVNAILNQQLVDIQNQLQTWSLEELLLLQQDKDLMDRIRKTIQNMEEDEMSIVRLQATEANSSANSSVKMIGIISALGLIFILISIYLILTDITRSNKLRHQLIDERKKAEKLAKVKEEFLANMSHEIRTPLNSIIGFTEQLQKEKHNDKENRFINAIEHSSDHLLSIVNQILDYSRLEAGKVQRSDVTFSFGDTIREIYELFRIKSAAKNIWFAYHIGEHMPAYVYGDMVSYKQILINLINNAVKFTEKGSVEIKCTVDRTEGQVVYIKSEVMDTGHGIAPEMQETIFEEFTQGDADITRKYGGTGLGLAITKKLTGLLGGSISVRSRQHEGTVFTVIIPFRIAEKVTTVQQVSQPRLQPHFYNKSILLVDDEEMNLMLGKTILENWNIRTETALNADVALEKFHAQRFDMILLDVQMPGISGLELARTIRAIDSDYARAIPIIVLTANVYNDFSMLENGINDILIKPFKERELLEKLERYWNVPNPASLPVDGNETKAVNKQHHNGKTIMNNNNSNNEKGYDLSFLTSTSGANQEFVTRMVHSFIQNNWDNISGLNRSLNANDLSAIQRLAHKMIPSYRYLRITQTESELKLLEKLAEEGTEMNRINDLVAKITEDTHYIINLLAEEINEKTPSANTASTTTLKTGDNENEKQDPHRG